MLPSVFPGLGKPAEGVFSVFPGLGKPAEGVFSVFPGLGKPAEGVFSVFPGLGKSAEGVFSVFPGLGKPLVQSDLKSDGCEYQDLQSANRISNAYIHCGRILASLR